MNQYVIDAVNNKKYELLENEGYKLRDFYFQHCYVNPEYLELFENCNEKDLENPEIFPPLSIVWVE